MASRLYREGKGWVENGVECDSILVEIDQLEAMLSAGWSVDVPGAKSEEFEKTDEEIRQAAKEAGIDGWDTKRISTLRKLLEA